MADTAYNIEAHHADMFRDVSQLRAQQLTVQLRETGIEEPATGRTVQFDQVGESDWVENHTRFAASPHQDISHYRRQVTPRDFLWGHVLDDSDRVQTFTQLDGKYVAAGTGGWARTFDSILLNALGGTSIAVSPSGTTSNIVLPSTQKVAITVGGSSGDVNMNETKVREAMSIIGSNEVDFDDPLNRVYGVMPSACFWKGLMGQDKFVSSDYNVIKPLANGKTIVEWMNITWFLSERCPFISGGGATDRNAYIWCKSGLGIAIWKDLQSLMFKRPDLSNADYLFMRGIVNMTRIEEAKVVEIAVDTSASATTNP